MLTFILFFANAPANMPTFILFFANDSAKMLTFILFLCECPRGDGIADPSGMVNEGTQTFNESVTVKAAPTGKPTSSAPAQAEGGQQPQGAQAASASSSGSPPQNNTAQSSGSSASTHKPRMPSKNPPPASPLANNPSGSASSIPLGSQTFPQEHMDEWHKEKYQTTECARDDTSWCPATKAPPAGLNESLRQIPNPPVAVPAGQSIPGPPA